MKFLFKVVLIRTSHPYQIPNHKITRTRRVNVNEYGRGEHIKGGLGSKLSPSRDTTTPDFICLIKTLILSTDYTGYYLHSRVGMNRDDSRSFIQL